MLDRNRVVKKPSYSSSMLFANQIFNQMPDLEEMVEDADIQCCVPGDEQKFKRILTKALKTVRNYLVETGTVAVRDFTNAYFGLSKKTSNLISGETQSALRFRTKEELFYKTSAAEFSSDQNMLSVKQDLFDHRSEDEIKHYMTHELVHYFTMEYSVLFVDKNGRRVFISPYSFQRNNEDNKVKKFVSNDGGWVADDTIGAEIYKSKFFLEGYTELLTQMMCPQSKCRAYKPQTDLIELLHYVTGIGYDFTDFLRMNVETAKEKIGEANFEQMFVLLNKFQEKYSQSDFDYKKDEDYLKAQEILISSFFVQISEKYYKDKDKTAFLKSIAKLVEFLPAPSDDINEKLLQSIQSVLGKDFSSNDMLLGLVFEALTTKSNMTGLDKNVGIKGLDVSIEMHYESGFALHVMGHTFSNQYIAQLINKKHFERIDKPYDEKNKKQHDEIKISGNENGIIINDYVDGQAKRYLLYYVEVPEYNQIGFDVIETDIDGKNRKVINQLLFYGKDPDKTVDEDLDFVSSFESAEKIAQKVKMQNVKKITLIDQNLSPMYESDSQEIFMVDCFDGERYFYLTNGKGKVELEPICDIKTREFQKPAASLFLLEMENQKSTNTYYSGNSDQKVVKYILENGLEIEELIDTKTGASSFSMKAFGINIGRDHKVIFDHENKDLVTSWSMFSGQAFK